MPLQIGQARRGPPQGPDPAGRGRCGRAHRSRTSSRFEAAAESGRAQPGRAQPGRARQSGGVWCRPGARRRPNLLVIQEKVTHAHTHAHA